jgi:branched-chain amino acid transport system substrate-binding protein
LSEFGAPGLSACADDRTLNAKSAPSVEAWRIKGGPAILAIVTRPLLGPTLAVAALAGLSAAAFPQIPGDKIKIGVLSDFSGPFADQVGKGSLVGAELAAEDFAKEAGSLTVEVISADHQNKPDIGVAIARRWVDEEGVDAIVDLANSGVGLAVNALMREKNRAMLASATATSDLTGKFCQPTTVQWALDTWALGSAVGRTITRMGGSSWFFISFEYALGKALQRDASEAIVKAGGTVVGSVSHPLGATDFGSYLLQAQASGAQVIALADTGVDAINAIRQAAEFQIVGPDARLAALFLQITDIDALGLKAAQGLILSEAFYWDLNDSTRAFSARFAERMGGRMPTEDQAAAYSATLAYLRAVKAAGTIEGDRVLAEMKKSAIDDPLFGRVVVRMDGRATHAMYVFRVKAPEQSKSRYDVYDLIETIPPEAAFRPLDQGGCPLVK